MQAKSSMKRILMLSLPLCPWTTFPGCVQGLFSLTQASQQSTHGPLIHSLFYHFICSPPLPYSHMLACLPNNFANSPRTEWMHPFVPCRTSAHSAGAKLMWEALQWVGNIRVSGAGEQPWLRCFFQPHLLTLDEMQIDRPHPSVFYLAFIWHLSAQRNE